MAALSGWMDRREEFLGTGPSPEHEAVIRPGLDCHEPGFQNSFETYGVVLKSMAELKQ